MKKMFVFVVAFAAAAILAPVANVANAQEKERTIAERGGELVGRAQLCQEHGRLLADYRVIALRDRLASAEFHEEREKVLKPYRGADSIDGIEAWCEQVDKSLDEWMKAWGISFERQEK